MSTMKLLKEEAFFQDLESHLQTDSAEKNATDLMLLSRKMFELFPLDEWIEQGIRFHDVIGLLRHFQRLLSDPTKTFIKVFNPTQEEDGWISEYTNIFVIHKDIPFLMDAILVELDRRDINIQTAKSCIFGLDQDEAGHLKVRADYNDISSSSTTEEVIVFLQIDRSESTQECLELENEIVHIVEELEWTTNDSEAILQRLGLCRSELSDVTGNKRTNRVELIEFLDWLREHFTFLGYSHTAIEINPDTDGFIACQDLALGVMRRVADNQPTTIKDGSIGAFYRSDNDSAFAKSIWHSRIYKYTYADEIRVKHRNDDGHLIGEHHFVGLYSADAISPFEIPCIRRKVKWMVEQSGMKPYSYADRTFRRIIEEHPRDDLFNSSREILFDTLIMVWQIHDRRKVKCFINYSPFNNIATCQIYIPKSSYTKDVVKKIELLLKQEFDTDDCQWKSSFPQSTLARLHFTLLIHSDRHSQLALKSLEQKIFQAVRDWAENFTDVAETAWGAGKARAKVQQYKGIFPASYKNQFAPEFAVKDIELLETLNQQDDVSGTDIVLGLTLLEDDPNIELRLLHPDHHLELSEIVPILESIGFQVSGEYIYKLLISLKQTVWLHVITLKTEWLNSANIEQLGDYVKTAFIAVWYKQVENDTFNRLVMAAGLHWRLVSMLRLYARYLKQLQVPFSQKFIAETLINNLAITKCLIEFFELRFNPVEHQKDVASTLTSIEQQFIEDLDQVKSLNEDQVLRSYLEIIKATLRTNFYQQDVTGQPKPYIAIKLASQNISFAPQPKPLYEIYIGSPRFEGVHLRMGKVARGGIRWSDRAEDYRIEILRLVKAQQIKNAIIVPVGAKGGFVTKQLASFHSRDEQLEEGIACYQQFISGLLDVTDNIVSDQITTPDNIIAYDGSDPYLVVAADKGTATFSDYANAISQQYGFWLKDGFASGGSNGYDHKQMGITARGAWISVQRHFREQGLNTQVDDFSVVGIGDMSGDVFGNGMLLSEHICLVAAFNHQHIFIDPEPNAVAGFKERQRLFQLPGSSWEDYDQTLISAGGGVFSRSKKTIHLSSQIRDRLDIAEKCLTPNELINYLLKAQVDLIWNGGIGTYVKSSREHDSDVGDRTNGSVRVNANELRCRIFGEGGNLGITQLGRVEFGLRGGLCNTDSVDNAGGVDCSDHEVNIKILLDGLVAESVLDDQARNDLLASMTADVAELVLHNNYQQTQAISLAQFQCERNFQVYERCMNNWEARGWLNRALEKLPDERILSERKSNGTWLARSELSVLISYGKILLKEELLNSELIDDNYIKRWLLTAFPARLAQGYSKGLSRHPLKREIIANQLANKVVNRMGFAFCGKQAESTGASLPAVVQSVVIVEEILNLDQAWQDIENLDYQLHSAEQLNLFGTLMKLTRHCSRWILRNHGGDLDTEQIIMAYKPHMQHLQAIVPSFYDKQRQAKQHPATARLIVLGVSESTAQLVNCASDLYCSFGAASIAIKTDFDLDWVANTYFKIGVALQLDWLSEQIVGLPVENRWDDFAYEALIDDLEVQRRILTQLFLNSDKYIKKEIDTMLTAWKNQHKGSITRWTRMLAEIKTTADKTSSMVLVLLSELKRLAFLPVDIS